VQLRHRLLSGGELRLSRNMALAMQTSAPVRSCLAAARACPRVCSVVARRCHTRLPRSPTARSSRCSALLPSSDSALLPRRPPWLPLLPRRFSSVLPQRIARRGDDTLWRETDHEV